MGMSGNMLSLVRFVAENNLEKARKYALCCCAEDKTQKNSRHVERYKQLLTTGGMNLIELPPNISQFAAMEDVSMTFLEERYYLAESEKKLFELIRDMNDVSLQLMEKKYRT